MAVNEAQQQAIRHGTGPMMVLAGPGSGKTYVITRRIRYLIEHYGIPPEQILVITFTKAAAMEMRSRFEELMNDHSIAVNFGTFHAVYYHILKRSYHFEDSDIITEKEKRAYLKEILDSRLGEDGGNDSYIPLLLNDFSFIKNHGISSDEHNAPYLTDGSFHEIYQAYQKRMWNERKLDFDDMVLLCHRLFRKQPDILNLWREMYQYILIDEFQDINKMQYEVIKMIAAPENNLFVVGDDDQAIYGFRGSDPSIMLNFPREYENCGQVILKYNYRCTNNIVNGALRLINHNKNRFMKKLSAEKEGHRDLIVTGFDSKEAEVEEVLSLIKEYYQYGDYKDIAILFRTNVGASFISQRLTQERIPFYLKEKIRNPFDDPMALDIIAMLRFAHGENERKHFLRFMNKPVRYLRRDTIKERVDLEELQRFGGYRDGQIRQIKRLQYDLNVIKEMHPFAAINYIRKAVGYEIWAVQNAKEKRKEREKILEMLDFIQNSAVNVETLKEWLDMLEAYEENLKHTGGSDEEDAVSLMTMHGSKGLEYKVVILPDLNEGNIPQKKAVTPKELEEERRVLYVAMTRAKEKLFLFYVRKTKENRLYPSRFLKEIT